MPTESGGPRYSPGGVEESTTPDPEEREALYRAALPDGTDVAHIADDDAVWAAFSQAGAALYTPDFIYEDTAMPDHFGETYRVRWLEYLHYISRPLGPHFNCPVEPVARPARHRAIQRVAARSRGTTHRQR